MSDYDQALTYLRNMADGQLPRRQFRSLCAGGYRRVGPWLVNQGWPLQELVCTKTTQAGSSWTWVHVDILPPDFEAAQSYVRSVNGTLAWETTWPVIPAPIL